MAGAERPVARKLAETYQQYRQGLFAMALSITRDADRAEDAVHEAFARLCAGRKQPRGDVVPYVFAAVRNAAIDQVRRHRLPPMAVSIYEDAVAADPAVEAVEAERRALLREAVEALPARQRQAVILRVYAGLTFEQMAETLGEPLPTVASRYRRALARLRDRCGSLR